MGLNLDLTAGCNMAALLVFLTVTACGQTDAAAASKKIADEVKALVAQLDAKELSQREAAEKALVALGPDVLSHLPATNNRTAAELRNRLARVRNVLGKLEAETATKPSLVTLSGEMPASEALAEISRQTGNKLVDYRERFNQAPADPKITVKLEKVTFWEALDTVLDATNLTIYNFDEEKSALAYTSRMDGGPSRREGASYAGLFRLEPVRIEATRDLRGSGLHSLKLTVDAIWEPRIRPIVLEVLLGEAMAQDEKQGAIDIDRSGGSMEVPVESSNTAVEVEFPLVAPARSVSKIGVFKGKLSAVLLGKVESFEFAEVQQAQSVSQERGGVTVTVESCRRNGDIWDVNMRVKFDKAANALESHRGWIYENDCYMLDNKNNRIENAGLEATLLSVNEVGLSYKFDTGESPSLAGMKFVYCTPAAIIKTPVEFELKNIDLP